MGSQLGGDVRRYMGHLMTHLLGKHRMNAGMVLEWDDMVHVCVWVQVCQLIVSVCVLPYSCKPTQTRVNEWGGLCVYVCACVFVCVSVANVF
jgi:hypothetical protein